MRLNRTQRRFPRSSWLLVALALLLHAVPAEAQMVAAAPDSLGVISGYVVDAESRAPLEGARVELQWLRNGPGSRAGVEEGQVVRRVMTDADGRYRFRRLSPGVYRVNATRIGYLPISLAAELEGGERRLSVALMVDPVTLDAVKVTGTRTAPYLGGSSAAADEPGSRAERMREHQEQHLVSDARRLTHADVIESVTLGESDIFRAIQRRMPGVNTRDDFTATLWTRGATWDQTRVFFDGMPLYNPTHAGWLFSSINPDAVGEATFHPGVRPARWGEGAAAVLDVRSRSAGYDGGVRGRGELSVSSARAAVDGRLLNDNLGVLVAARRSYLDLVSGMAAQVGGDEQTGVPYHFSDVVARVDAELGEGWRMEASGLVEMDDLRGDIRDVVRGNEAQWGNLAGRATLEAPLGRLRAALTLGGTHFGTRVRVRPDSVVPADSATLPAMRNSIDYRTVRLSIGPEVPRGEVAPWDAGVQVVWDSVTYYGPSSLLTATVLKGRQVQNDTTMSRSLLHTALWAERRWQPFRRLDLLTGMRWELGSPVGNAGRHRLAPRLMARYTVDDATAISGGWSRSFQYVQDIAPIAGPVGPELHISSLWELAGGGEDQPVLRSDIFTGGLTRWLGRDWLVAVSSYGRWSTGLRVPNPEQGHVADAIRTAYPASIADNVAWGVELSAEKVTGRWTTALNYAYGESTLMALVRRPDGSSFVQGPYPSSADIRHNLDALGWFRLTPRLHTGAAFTYVSGVPFTRLTVQETFADVGKANQVRTPDYASLDLMLEYETTVSDWNLGLYIQLRNALDRENLVTYSQSWLCREAKAGATAVAALRSAGSPGCDGSEPYDEFREGLPRLPLIGVRVAF